MRTHLLATAWIAASFLVVALAVRPDAGVIFRGPGMTLGLGLIGVGMLVDAKRRSAAAGNGATR